MLLGKLFDSLEPDEDTDRISLLRRFEIERLMTSVLVGVGTFWIILAAYAGEPYVVGLGMLVALVSLVLLRFKHIVLARHLWLLSGISAIFLGACIIHESANMSFMFLAAVGAPLLVFSIKHELDWIVLYISVPVILWSILQIFGNEAFGIVVVSQDVAEQYFKFPAQVSTVAIIMLQLISASLIANTYSQQIFKANKAAFDAAEAKSKFLADMSHEIRTPMNGVIGLIDTLSASELDRDQRRVLQTMQDCSSSLLRIIDDILDSSKLETKGINLMPERTELLSWFESSIAALYPIASNKNVRLKVHFDPDLPQFVEMDQGRIRQILSNLGNNAIKFSSKERGKELGNVLICLNRTFDNSLTLVVEDDGIGIADDKLQEIFEPFSQAERHTSAWYGGTGLGLTIVRQIVHLLDGEIEISSCVGSGTKISVHLPIIGAENETNAPDLDGKTVYAYIEDPSCNPVLDKYISATGAVTRKFWEKTAFLDALSSSAPDDLALIVLSDTGALTAVELFNAINARCGKLKILVVSALPAKTFADYENVCAVSRFPLFPTELWSAMEADDFHENEKYLVIPSDQYKKTRELEHERVFEHFAELSILVAEDNAVNRLVMAEKLKQLGCDVTFVENGEDAYNAVCKHEYDVIFCDCYMPKLNGFEFTEKLKAMEISSGRKRTPVIATTANPFLETTNQCFDVGMDQILTKPFRFEQLEKVLSLQVS